MLDTDTVAFFGHRHIDNVFEIDKRLDGVIEKLIRKERYVEFLVGRNGDFDRFVSSAVLRAKGRIRKDNSSLILVLPYLTAEYKENQRSFEEYYDEIELCETSVASYFKSAIQVRNREMVDRADLIVCWIERRSGGVYQAVNYAIKQGKKIINLAEDEGDHFFA